MNEIDNNLSADEEVETFEHVPNEVFNLLSDFFYQLKEKADSYVSLKNKASKLLQKQKGEEVTSDSSDSVSYNKIDEAITCLNSHPNPPEKDTCISFQVDDTSFSVIYTSYKIELSDYISEHGDWGSDHYQRFNFRYEIEGYSEQEGDLDEFRSLLFSCLSEVKLSDICISEEE
ncbi:MULTISPECIES: hypothetical protein [unclassified Carboxylicivirga]|uniref:hypothetical protein n=1 Tax=Carboxylicivirga TaxID=1628153 RepID=UPI003D343612